MSEEGLELRSESHLSLREERRVLTSETGGDKTDCEA